MTSIFAIDKNNDMWMMLPGGVYILARHHYSPAESKGVLAVSIASMVSVLAILALFLALAISLFRKRRKGSEHVDKRHNFIKSHAGVYFLCMLVTTLTYTVGFMLSIVWAVKGTIDFGTFCNVQAALKQFGNLATAFWVLSIAVHTFTTVFLERQVPNFVFYIVFCSVWLLSGFIVAIGPLFYTTEQMGPWYGISSQWCWTSDTYSTPRFATEYLWMFTTAGLSFLLYTLLFLKLRGYLGSDFRLTFHPRPLGETATRVARQMLWYPVIYSALVFPIAACRIYEVRTSKETQIDVKMASATIFVLSGLVNVILYTVTRNIFPVSSFLSRISQSNFRRLSRATAGDSPTVPIFTRDPEHLEKYDSRSSQGGNSVASSPRGSRPGSRQGQMQEGRNPFDENVADVIVPSPVAAYARQARPRVNGNYPTRTVSLVGPESIGVDSPISAVSKKNSFDDVKRTKAVIKKPPPSATRFSVGEDAPVERAVVQRSLSAQV